MRSDSSKEMIVVNRWRAPLLLQFALRSLSVVPISEITTNILSVKTKVTNGFNEIHSQVKQNLWLCPIYIQMVAAGWVKLQWCWYWPLHFPRKWQRRVLCNNGSSCDKKACAAAAAHVSIRRVMIIWQRQASSPCCSSCTLEFAFKLAQVEAEKWCSAACLIHTFANLSVNLRRIPPSSVLRWLAETFLIDNVLAFQSLPDVGGLVFWFSLTIKWVGNGIMSLALVLN